jgi:hypothetical protein
MGIENVDRLKPEDLGEYLRSRNSVLRVFDGRIVMVSKEDLELFETNKAAFAQPESKIEFSGVTPEELVEQFKADGREARVIDGVVHVDTEIGTLKLEVATD